MNVNKYININLRDMHGAHTVLKWTEDVIFDHVILKNIIIPF